MLKGVAGAGVLAGVLVAVWLGFAPTPVDPVAWTSPPAPASPVNDMLKDVQRLAMGLGEGPEGIAIDASGSVYAGFGNGLVIALSADGGSYREIGHTGGRPLGIGFASDGSVLAADSLKGLLKLDGKGEPKLLTNSSNGLAFRCADDVVAASDGTIYFTDASSKFPLSQYSLDIIEHRGNGRLLRYDPASGKTDTLLDDLYFANGVTLGPDEAYLLVNETGAYRITRYWLKGEHAGTHEVFVDNLPGFPDNISFNGRDRFWVAIASPRQPAVDQLAGKPGLRKVIARLPDFLLPKAKAQSFVLAFDIDGKPVADLQYAGPGAYGPITSVRESGPWLWFGSLGADAIARLPLNRVFLDAPAPPAGWEQAPSRPMLKTPSPS